MKKLPAYIDPGTGSMLFSLFIGLATTVYFSLKGLIFKLKFLITGGKKNASKSNVPFLIYSEGRQYWNVFKPILDEFEKRAICLIFYTSDKNDPFFSYKYNYVKGEYIGNSNKAFMKLAFAQADICLMTTPGLDVFQLKRSKTVKHYSHIIHSTSEVTGYAPFGIDYFDSVILSGNSQISAIRELEQKRNIPAKELIVAGCTYLDELNEKLKTLEIKKLQNLTVLLAPTWGKSGILTLYGEKFTDSLVKSGHNIIIRPHPQSLKAEKKLIEKLENRYKDEKNVVWDFEPDNITSMAKSDILISDFSGIILDYSFLFDKPFLYANQDYNIELYDAADVSHRPWIFEKCEKMGVALEEKDFHEISKILTEALKNQTLREERAKAKNEAWANQGVAGKNTVDALVRIHKGVCEC